MQWVVPCEAMQALETGEKTMRVIVGMETSGAIRSRLRMLGVDAWSVDTLPADDGSPYHIVGDVFDYALGDWDWGIFHPTCTYLTCSAEWAYTDGPYHMKLQPGTLTGQARRDARTSALAEFWMLLKLPYPKAIENPVGVVSSRIRKPDQTVQPYMFGDDASKRTCLWLDRLPPLQKRMCSKWVPPRMVDGKPRWANQTDSGQNRLSPGPDRWKARSQTYPGLAQAAATQWLAHIQKEVRVA